MSRAPEWVVARGRAKASVKDHARRVAAEVLGGGAFVLEPLAGGQESAAYRCRHPSADLVVLVYPSWRRRAELEWALAVAAHAGSRVPEVVAALSVGSGRLVTVAGRLAAVFPYIEGVPLEVANQALALDAARVLAAIHCSLLDWDGGTRPEPGPEVPLHKRIDPAGVEMLAAQDIPGFRDDELDDWAEVTSSGWAACLTQGDFWSANLICQDMRLVGVIDWHDARTEICLSEAASAAWGATGQSLSACEDFLRAYQARGGPVEDEQLHHWVRLLRVRIRDSGRRAVAIGCPPEDPYLRPVIRSFQHLRDFQDRPFGSFNGRS